MPLHTFFTFTIATFFICVTPGPNMLHVMHSGMRNGLRPTFYTMAGLMTAVLTLTTASALGLGTVLAASPRLFDGLRYCGAAYLIYLGLRSLLKPAGAPVDADTTDDIPLSATPLRCFRGGLAVGLSNPKLLLFATAFFPQFIDKAGAELPQFCMLLATFFCIELGCYMAYALGGTRLSKHLENQAVQRGIGRLVGALFTGFGILLLKYKPA